MFNYRTNVEGKGIVALGGSSISQGISKFR